MKIAIDAREWSTTTGRYISNLVRELEIIDSTNNYLVLLYPKDMDKYKPSSPCFSKVICPHKEFSLDEQIGFKKQLDKLNVDLAHFGMVQQPVLYHGKTVTTVNDLTTVRFKNPSKNSVVYWLKQQVYKWVNKRVAKKANALITYTQFVKKDFANYAGINPDKITVTPLAVEELSGLPKPVLVEGLEGKQFIMYVGRPLPHKNLGRLIDAYAEIKKAHPDLYLVLAGKKDALYEAHERRVREKGITDVVFTGFISDAQLRWLYEHCRAYIFPSLSEGFGLPGLEAMAHGAPVVSSNATCLPEVYGDAAEYFDPTIIQSMVSAIDRVLTDEARRAGLIALGQKQAQKYSWRRTAEQTLAVYEQALKS
jgi:glycosyltransferase involved in cell wall biosynthesis